MSKIADLKDKLVDTLMDQISNGVTVVTKEGEAITVDVGAPVLAVAAKVIKDWASETKAETAEAQKMNQLSVYLAQRRGKTEARGAEALDG